MNITPVTIPERRNTFGSLLGTVTNGLSIFGAGKTLFGSGDAPVTPVATSKVAAAPAGETAASASAPLYAGAAMGAGALGMGALIGTARPGSANYNPKMGSGQGPALRSWDAPTAEMSRWNSDTISRRLGASNALSGNDIMDARKTVESLDLPRSDKDSILGKLGQALNIGKLKIKIG